MAPWPGRRWRCERVAGAAWPDFFADRVGRGVAAPRLFPAWPSGGLKPAILLDRTARPDSRESDSRRRWRRLGWENACGDGRGDCGGGGAGLGGVGGDEDALG